jgi:hypothetical protein
MRTGGSFVAKRRRRQRREELTARLIVLSLMLRVMRV